MDFVRTRVLRVTIPAVLLQIGCLAGPAVAQTQPAQTAPANQDYTRREIQPNLDVDRDPVLSPDAADNGPVTATTAQTATKQGNNTYTLHENVDEVLLPCTVVDENGRLVTDLTQRDFRVWEDNIPQAISSFEHRDVPISLGILVDNSGSMRDKRETVDEAAVNLVRQSNPQDAAFIVNFNDKAYLDQGFTSNISYLEKGLSHYDARGTTAIYDAVVAAADELSKHGRSKPVLLVITDGEDNASRLTLAEAVRRVQALDGPVVYTIGLLYDSPSKQEADDARNALQTLSNQTGGIAYFPQSLQDVEGIATEVAQVIRNQYTVGYHSTRPPTLGGYRRVHVEALGPKHKTLTVRTKNGYYPQEIKKMHSAEAQTAQEIERGTEHP
jgi:VWFA-related protein